MLELPLGQFIKCHQSLSNFAQTLEITIANSQGVYLGGDSYMALLTDSKSMVAHCEAIGMQVSAGSAKESYDVINSAIKRDSRWNFDLALAIRCKGVISQFIGCVKHESNTKAAIMIGGQEIALYEQSAPLFGQDVSDKFPRVTYELKEAGKCLALGRSTAAVFHLMRMVEVALVAVGKCLSVSRPNSPNWFEWLKAIRLERLTRNKASSKGWAENDFFQDVWQRLDSIKDATRNSTMHVEQIYTEEEAKEIFEMTKGFMKKIANRMDESGLPLA